ncbi:hypothetical protein V6N12_005215 [Hibiscus sabdariffa]|uniref:Uncharacterized protein n=1 Tax=Hibiscus sabdariffa TaxID=183260 RepID=A0ABR2CNT5_9ROSI
MELVRGFNESYWDTVSVLFHSGLVLFLSFASCLIFQFWQFNTRFPFSLLRVLHGGPSSETIRSEYRRLQVSGSPINHGQQLKSTEARVLLATVRIDIEVFGKKTSTKTGMAYMKQVIEVPTSLLQLLFPNSRRKAYKY